ncbi:MAG: flavodoxin family protein [Muribaculaceae bacterium]|nr:flavodoxin family protein [Muribaculaceae bacterium]
MKVLIINGSPHPKGCTARALKEVADTLESQGIETETLIVGNKDIRGCIGCYKCQQTGKCVFNDLVNETAPKFKEADGLIIGTPVYYAHANGTLISFLDRLFFSTLFPKTMKVGATVVSSRRAGSTSAFDDINKYFTMTGMPVASSTYWNEVHGFTSEDVEKDLEGLQTMQNLGKSMAFLIKSIRLGDKDLGIPELTNNLRTHFIR